MPVAAPVPALPQQTLYLWATPRLESAARPTLWFDAERPFQLLAVASLHGGRPLLRDHVAALPWPAHGRAEALRNLRKVRHRAHARLAGIDPDARRPLPALEEVVGRLLAHPSPGP